MSKKTAAAQRFSDRWPFRYFVHFGREEIAMGHAKSRAAARAEAKAIAKDWTDLGPERRKLHIRVIPTPVTFS